MDYKILYEDLTKKLENELPLTAYPIRELVQIFRTKGSPITLKTKLIITNVFNSGDISGILCTLKIDDDIGHACSLTHLIFEPNSPLYKDIIEYQKKRYKRVQQLNKM